MQLISSLAAGISGAGLGTAKLYNRGTSTRATWYSDFEATTSSSSTADISLNSYGRAIVYVNGLVDVVVTKSGTEIARFTEGSGDANVEVRSSAVLGTAYDTLAQALGNPTTLRAFMNAWLTTSGGARWPLVDAFSDPDNPLTLAEAIGLGQGGEFVVTKYGAVGDGTTNDTAAIANADTAAAAAGGGVLVFPAGTYMITAAITLSEGVSLRGVGAGVSIISVNSASAHGLIFPGAVSVYMMGLGVDAQVSNTGSLVRVTGGELRLVACNIAQVNPSNAAGLRLEQNGGTARASGCKGTGLVSYVSVGALAGVTTGALNVTHASAPAAGLNRVGILAVGKQGAITMGLDPSFQYGYTKAADGFYTGGVVAIGVWLAGEPVEEVAGNNLAIEDVTNDLLGCHIWITGVDLKIGVKAYETEGAGTTLTSPTVTARRAGALVMDFVVDNDDADVATPDAGQTEIVDGTAGSATISLKISYKSMTAPGTTTMGWSALSAVEKKQITLVFEPADDF